MNWFRTRFLAIRDLPAQQRGYDFDTKPPNIADRFRVKLLIYNGFVSAALLFGVAHVKLVYGCSVAGATGWLGRFDKDPSLPEPAEYVPSFGLTDLIAPKLWNVPKRQR